MFKRGQITIFIILGIVLIAIIGVVLFLRTDLAKTTIQKAVSLTESFTSKTNEVQGIAEDCLKSKLSEATVLYGNKKVENYEQLIPALTLPDPNDRHVLAAAIRSSASVIVTFNLKDFPKKNLDKYGIEAQHPDNFIMHLLDLSPDTVFTAIRTLRNGLKKPPSLNALNSSLTNLFSCPLAYGEGDNLAPTIRSSLFQAILRLL